MNNIDAPSPQLAPTSTRPIRIYNPDVTYELRPTKKFTSREQDRVRLTLYWLTSMSLEDKERLVEGECLVFVTSIAVMTCLQLRLGSLVEFEVLETREHPTESNE